MALVGRLGRLALLVGAMWGMVAVAQETAPDPVPSEPISVPEGEAAEGDPAGETDAGDEPDPSAASVPDNIVSLVARLEGNDYRLTGVLVDPSTVLTTDIATRGRSGTAEVLGSGGRRITLERIARDTDLGLTLWESDDVLGAALVHALAIPDAGHQTRLLYADREGVQRELTSVAAALEGGELALAHADELPLAAFGGAAVNACGQLIGLNTPDDSYRRRDLRRGQGGEALTHIATLSEISAFLVANRKTAPTTTTPCTSALDQARQEADAARDREAERREEAERLQEEADASSTRAEELAKRAEELERAAANAQSGKAAAQREAEAARAEAEAAQSAAEAADARAEDVEKEADELLEELEEVEAEISELEKGLDLAEDNANRWQLYALIGVAFAIVTGLIGAVLVTRGRKRAVAAESRVDEVQQEVSRLAAIPKAVPRVPDILLEGDRKNLLLSGKILPEAAGGVIIGRHPQHASAVLEAEDISRRHARVFVSGGQAMIEDLGSSFGTRVNGQPISVGSPQVLKDGDRVELASHGFLCVRLKEMT